MIGGGRASAATKVILQVESVNVTSQAGGSLHAYIATPALVSHDERLAIVASLPSARNISPTVIGDVRQRIPHVLGEDQPVAATKVTSKGDNPTSDGVEGLA